MMSDVTCGRSKEASSGIVRGALSSLEEAGGGEGVALRALCEALIRVATAAPSDHHAMPRRPHAKVPPLLCASGGSSGAGSSSEDSVAGPYATDRSEPLALRPDDGYEADVEVGLRDAASHRVRKLSETLSNLSVFTDGAWTGPGAPAPLPGCAEYSRAARLAHPDLCIIVVDILTHLIDKLVKRDAEGAGGAEGAAECGALARACCARLAGALSRARAAPRRLLQRLLAPPVASLLSQTHPHLEELQRSILELVHVVASASIEPAELAALLRLLAAPRPPLPLLLHTLQRLLAAAEPHTPDAILTFPLDTDHSDMSQSTVDEVSHVELGTASQSQAAENTAKRLHNSHTRAGVVSPWSVCAAHCGVEGAGWAPWLQGFALTLWLRPQPPHTPHTPHTPHHKHNDHWDTVDEWKESSVESEPSKRSPGRGARGAELLHVVSVGHEALLFELWVDPLSGVFRVAVSRGEAGALGEARMRRPLPAHAWTFLALNVRETLHNKRIVIQVTLFVNGCECETVSLPLQGLLVRKVTPTNVLIGCGRSGGEGGGGAGYHLSGVRLYRTPLLSAYTALHLAAHGPDLSCQVRCESPNFPLVITEEVLDSNLDWEQVYEMSSTTLRELHDSLLLSFSAHAPTLINLYHQTIAPPTVFPGAAPAQGQGASIPETLAVRWAGAPRAAAHSGLPPALLVLGGPDVLLYLYARVVELEGSARWQARALWLVLRAARVDDRLHAQLHAAHPLDALLAVLAAPASRLSVHTLEVVLGEACSASPVRAGGAGGAGALVTRADCVLLDPYLLVFLVRAWKYFDAVKEVQWEVEGGARGGSGSLWALALRGARALLRDDHPRRAFNHFQMNRVDLLRHLLLACKERFLSAECGPLDASASASLVELVRGLMGAPPLLCHLALLCDFLVLMHQASDTFVTHSRANFYFLLTSETQDPAEFNLLAFVRARRASRAARRRARASDPDPDLDPAPSGDTYDNGLYVSTDGAQCREGDDNSLDSSKHIKGLINAEIKEARLRDTTSASENSELEEEAPPPPPPAAPRAPSPPLHDSGNGADGSAGDAGGARGEAPGEGEGEELPLNDFVVIDEDDVHHTTVEMYTSGIVHQGRVRAGAAPDWAACEGLLLLLRDSIGVLPDHALAQALCGAVQAESLVVLSNHRSGSVRAAVVRAACALQRRAPPDLARKLRQHFYIHLANQISLYPATRELAAACAALLTKCDVPLEDQLDDAIWTDLSEEALCRCPPLLALLPASLHDAPLAHKITRIIRRIIDKASLKTLSEVCVPEVVVRAVRGAGQRAQPDPHAPLLQDFTELLCRIALKGLAYPHNMQSVLELHHMLSFVESAGGAGARRAAREAQAALVCAQLEYLEARVQASAAPHKPASYFTTVLSSAVLGAESAARAEMGARLAARCGVALLTRHAHRAPLDAEVALFERLLDTLITGVCSERPRGWGGGLGSECAAALQEVVWWAARPAAAARALQPLLLRALYRRPAAAQHITPHEPALQRKLAVYLLTALKHAHLSASVELAVTDWARSWALSTQASLAERVRSDELHEEAAALLRQDLLRWAKDNHHALRTHVTKVVFSKDGLASKVTESAMAITRQVVELQNGERKAFMEHLRRAHSDAVAAAQRWQRLLDEYTHERALWHDPASYPQSWQLDPTEGPGRVRVRLRRAHLDIPPKFLKPEHRYKTEHAQRAGPLRGVVGGCGEVRSGLVALLQLKETVRYMARAWHVTVAQEVRGELLLTDRCVHFVPDEGEGEGTAEGEGGALTWPLECVRRVAPRRWCLQERALELFLQGGRAHLLAFLDLQHREHFLRALDNCHLPNRVEPESLSEATGLWRSGAITNWEYIMKLNGLAGRSYNDLMQYPVLPFVLADYTSRILDLDDPASFRDLTKPMAIQNKNREQHYIKNYNDLKLARHEGHSPLRQPHHYASLYSNSGGVLHYLVRLPPFTELFLNYQDNNFDMPDRTFHSLTTTWRLITNDSPTDVKELIPELFYLPELFHNNEGLELGVRQCGAGVDSVEVPPWAGEARMFTLLHRQALEAPLVTDALPHWIDLVFGYKQTGQPAVDALNVFPACTYYGFDPTALELEVDRTAAATMVRTYGQAPRQLLRAPHPHVAGEVAGRAGGASGAAPWGGVAGARWGRYCGSPSMPPPTLVARRSLHGAGVPAQVYALPHARAAALAPLRAALLALPAGEAGGGAAAGGAPGARALALLTWGHSDGVVRLKRRRDLKPDLLMHMPAFDHITCVWSSSSSSWSGWAGAVAGLWSGRVVAWRAHGAVPVRPRVLHAHRAPLAALHASEPAHTLASASTDGLIVLWDLHTLSYIRTLPNRDMLPVTHLTISDTLADVASVHDLTAPSQPDRPDPPGLQEDSDSYERATDKFSSLIRVHTVNASFVGSVKVAERVTGVCYSRAPEGVSVNSVATALHTGAVRLYSSWDLRPVTYIPAACAGVPLLSVAFSSDSALLFGCYAGGVACAWESAGAARAQPVRLLSAHALF